MRLPSSTARILVFIIAAAAAIRVTFVTATAEPQTIPRESDVATAEREVEVPAGATDFRSRHPDGNWTGGMGLIEPAQPETRVAPLEPGLIVELAVNEGDFVEAGAPLARLDDTIQQQALAVAQAELAVTEAELGLARRGQRSEDIDALQAELEQARARSELSAGVFERLESLLASGTSTRDEVDRAQRQAEADAAAVLSAESRLAASRRARPENVLIAEARVLAARARVDQATQTLARRIVQAPSAGEILEIKYRVGEFIQPGGAEPLLVMGDTRTLTARIDVDERDIAAVRPGAQAILIVDAYPEREFTGTVEHIARRMGRKNLRTDEPLERIDTKILEVVVRIQNSEGLVPGQRVMGYIGRAP